MTVRATCSNQLIRGGNIARNSYAPLITNASGQVAAGGLVAAAASSAVGSQNMIYVVQTVYGYYPGTNGPTANLAGEIASSVQEAVDEAGNVAGSSAPTYYSYDGDGNRLAQTQVGTVDGVPGQLVMTRYQYDTMSVATTNDVMGRMAWRLLAPANAGEKKWPRSGGALFPLLTQ